NQHPVQQQEHPHLFQAPRPCHSAPNSLDDQDVHHQGSGVDHADPDHFVQIPDLGKGEVFQQVKGPQAIKPFTVQSREQADQQRHHQEGAPPHRPQSGGEGLPGGSPGLPVSNRGGGEPGFGKDEDHKQGEADQQQSGKDQGQIQAEVGQQNAGEHPQQGKNLSDLRSPQKHPFQPLYLQLVGDPRLIRTAQESVS